MPRKKKCSFSSETTTLTTTHLSPESPQQQPPASLENKRVGGVKRRSKLSVSDSSLQVHHSPSPPSSPSSLSSFLALSNSRKKKKKKRKRSSLWLCCNCCCKLCIALLLLLLAPLMLSLLNSLRLMALPNVLQLLSLEHSKIEDLAAATSGVFGDVLEGANGAIRTAPGTASATSFDHPPPLHEGDHTKPLKPHHPLVLIPGTITTGLELWSGAECALGKYFRQRWWGKLTMMQSLVSDRMCWMEHMRLDNETFMDPPGIKLRAAQGLEAGDYFIQGFWVWGKLIENLASIGYDNNNLFMASYDWRLAFPLLELRDAYFTKLKSMVELAKRTNHNRKVVLVTHSMGSNLVHYFLNWVEDTVRREREEAAAHSGPGVSQTTRDDFHSDSQSTRASSVESWSEVNLEAVVSVGGSWLGSTKAASLLISGEMRDTAGLGPVSSYLVDSAFTRQQRLDLFRTWGSVSALLPRGGNKIWGNSTWAPDDPELWHSNNNNNNNEHDIQDQPRPIDYNNSTNSSASKENFTEGATGGDRKNDRSVRAIKTLGTTIAFSLFSSASSASSDPNSGSNSTSASSSSSKNIEDVVCPPNEWPSIDNHCLANLTMDEMMAVLSREVGTSYSKRILEESDSFGVASKANLNSNAMKTNLRYWSNPLESPLPPAKSMKIYCLYGVGKQTERGYFYRRSSMEENQLMGVFGRQVTSLQELTKKLIRRGEEAIGFSSSVPEMSVEESPSTTETPASAEEPHEASATPPPISGIGELPSMGVPAWIGIDKSVGDVDNGVEFGVVHSDGDGTVPLVSLGYMCVKGWHSKKYNPSNLRVVTREYRHAPASLLEDLRGGPHTADHVDIMGNVDLNNDILAIAAGYGRRVEDRISSDIQKIADRIDPSILNE